MKSILDTVQLENVVARVEAFDLLLGLFLGALFALILSLAVRRYSKLIGDKTHFTTVFLMLIPTTVLVINIIKSSLVLSLGLVGALSIVRFRTPIKEPEELVYLFFAIALGLGLGANQVIPTTIAFVFIILLLFVLGVYRKKNSTQGIFLDLEVKFDKNRPALTQFSKIFEQHQLPYEMKQYNEGENYFTVTYYLESHTMESMNAVMSQIREIDQAIHLSLTQPQRLLS